MVSVLSQSNLQRIMTLIYLLYWIVPRLHGGHCVLFSSIPTFTQTRYSLVLSNFKSVFANFMLHIALYSDFECLAIFFHAILLEGHTLNKNIELSKAFNHVSVTVYAI